MKAEPESTIDEEPSETNQHGTAPRNEHQHRPAQRDSRQQHTLRDELQRHPVQRDPRGSGPQ